MNEPGWMRDIRLRALDHYLKTPLPSHQGDLSPMHLDDLSFHLPSPDERAEFAWRRARARDDASAPHISTSSPILDRARSETELAFQKRLQQLAAKGVVFTDMATALHEHSELVRQYFGTIISSHENKLCALNSVAWHDGVFVYVLKGIELELPLQKDHRGDGIDPFVRTLIVCEENSRLHFIDGCTAPVFTNNSLHAPVVEIVLRKGARCRYTSMQNWSNHVHVIDNKRSLVSANAAMEWMECNMGGKLTVNHPSVHLTGSGARAEIISLSFIGDGQFKDTGGEVIHRASRTTSSIRSRSLCKESGHAINRGFLHATKSCRQVQSRVECDTLFIDPIRVDNTYSRLELVSPYARTIHEARVAHVGEDQIRDGMARGLNRAEARMALVNGFIEPLAKELPMEYVVEFKNLIELEMEGSLG